MRKRLIPFTHFCSNGTQVRCPDGLELDIMSITALETRAYYSVDGERSQLLIIHLNGTQVEVSFYKNVNGKSVDIWEIVQNIKDTIPDTE